MAEKGIDSLVKSLHHLRHGHLHGHETENEPCDISSNNHVTPAPIPIPSPPRTDLELFKRRLQAKEKVAKIHFYIQDALGGVKATVYQVATADITATSTTSFGQVRVLDDVITAAPEATSEEIGRAQGVITFSDLTTSALTMSLNFYFTSGEYKGSSLCIIGRNPIGSTDRELPIVGGTGVFRMARGYSISNTYSYDAVTNYGVLEYTNYVAYVDEDSL